MGWKWRAYFALAVLTEVGLLSGGAWARWRTPVAPPDGSAALSQRALVDPAFHAPAIPLSNDRVRREVDFDGMVQKSPLGAELPPQLGDYGTTRR